ncbi:MAG: signal peptidase I [Gammaproteobacteria bacterium]|nr:signal peptidase I [Gammaproteobacteria bacterium]
MDLALVFLIALGITGTIIVLHNIWTMIRARNNDFLESPKLPRIVDYSRSFFPIILIVFLLRSFVVEPFRIPSGSMLPNLHIGDFILVNKYVYGLRLPVIHNKIANFGSPDRGDVMVFRYPVDPKLNFIKRVVALPGDELSYVNKRLSINGVEVTTKTADQYFPDKNTNHSYPLDQFVEMIGSQDHRIITDNNRGSRDLERVIVPEGHFFVLGDNRDHSNDSRYWRFVPENHIVGKAFMIWFSWKGSEDGWVDWSRIGSSIE